LHEQGVPGHDFYGNPTIWFVQGFAGLLLDVFTAGTPPLCFSLECLEELRKKNYFMFAFKRLPGVHMQPGKHQSLKKR